MLPLIHVNTFILNKVWFSYGYPYHTIWQNHKLHHLLHRARNNAKESVMENLVDILEFTIILSRD